MLSKTDIQSNTLIYLFDFIKSVKEAMVLEELELEKEQLEAKYRKRMEEIRAFDPIADSKRMKDKKHVKNVEYYKRTKAKRVAEQAANEELVTCECGLIETKGKLAEHMEGKFHQAAMEQV